MSRPTSRKLSTTAWILSTGLSPCVACLPRQFLYLCCYYLLAPPLSLAATHRISVDFFSSGYLDVSVLPVRLTRLFYSPRNDRLFAYRVSPFGHRGLNASYQLTHAFRRLARPSSPLIAKASALYAFSLNYTTSRIFLPEVVLSLRTLTCFCSSKSFYSDFFNLIRKQFYYSHHSLISLKVSSVFQLVFTLLKSKFDNFHYHC